MPEGDENIEELRAGRVDLDIGMQHDLAPDIATADLFTDRFVAIVAHGHRLTLGRLTPPRLAGEGHISMSRRGRARSPLDDSLDQLGLTRRIAVIVPTPAAATAVAAATDLVAILPSLAATLSPVNEPRHQRHPWCGSAGGRNTRAWSMVGAGDPLGDPVEDDVESEHEVFVRVLALLVEGAMFDHRGDRRVAMAVE